MGAEPLPRARWRRSAKHPCGVPGLPPKLKEKVRMANTLIDNAARLLLMAASLGIPCGEENPHTSILWYFACRHKLLQRWPAVYVDFCSSGGPARKRTRLLFIHCGKPDASRLQCHTRGGICNGLKGVILRLLPNKNLAKNFLR